MEPEPQPVPEAGRQPDKAVPPAAIRYLVTLQTKDRAPWLAAVRTRGIVLAVLRSWHGERHGRILCVTVLPDRVLILLELGAKLEIAQVIAGWKAATRRAAGYAETFESEFGGHRLSTADEAEDCALYVFLMPYRAGLLATDKTWPGFWAPNPENFHYTSALNATGGPAEEWLAWPEDRFKALAHEV